jgi:hypothetical protein
MDSRFSSTRSLTWSLIPGPSLSTQAALGGTELKVAPFRTHITLTMIEEYQRMT